ncbi:adenylate cyclase-associated CAP, partial [Tribonema minus]
MATSQLQQLLDNFESRLAVVEQSLSITPAAGAAAGSRSAAAEQDAPYVMAYDSYCQLKLEPFVAASAKLGGGAAKGGDIVKRAWAAQRDFLVMASKCKKPAQQADLMAKLKPLQELVKRSRLRSHLTTPHARTPLRDVHQAAGAIVSRDEWEMHAKTVNEGLGCLMWVAIAPPAGLPKDTVISAVGGSDYWANKIRVQYKKTGPPEQVEFCDTFKALLVGLEEYVVEHHKAGLEWNARGGEVAAYTAGDAAAAPAAAAA